VDSLKRFKYCPKTSKSDRNEGCDELDEKQRPGQTDKGNYSSSPVCKDCGKTVNGSNDHSNCKEGLEYRPSTTTTKNNHPTVKPTDLMRYLVRLVTPKGGTVLDPFMGSGSTGKGAVLEGMNFVGIERETEYYEIAQNRISIVNKEQHHEKFFE
jgi:site-specific DNA-methyltransferase (adenine-specific)